MNTENSVNFAELPHLNEVWEKTLGWVPSVAQQGQFMQLYQEVIRANKEFNLTRISEVEEFWEKHLWDSLRGIWPVFKNQQKSSLKVIDIGTGAGFPGVPVAIIQPEWQLTLLDSTRKKMQFIESLVLELKLENIKTITARVEEIGRDADHREVYDLALIRAVGIASVAAEYALPLLTVNGTAILYRGHWSEEETKLLEPVLKKLGGELSFVDSFTTPLSNSIRHCLHIKKIAKTPQIFPRKAGLAAKNPL